MSNERSVMAVIKAARPSFRNDQDKIAFSVHASILSSGFVLTATAPHALADNVVSSPSNETGEVSRRDINDAGVRINESIGPQLQRIKEPIGPQLHPSGVVVPPIYLFVVVMRLGLVLECILPGVILVAVTCF
ncbi:hypothetical protein CRYUN_Cryun09bG0015400 [Craigia yunnanensis]